MCFPCKYAEILAGGSYVKAAQIGNTMRIKQRLLKNVELPLSAYPGWSEVFSLDELANRINYAKNMGRMIIVVCSKQNQSFWLPQAFYKWAPLYPRLMFASIDRDIANTNACVNPDLCRNLLGFDYIDGVCFVSHVAGQPPRAFNGTGRSTEDIFASLLTRYKVNIASGVMSPLEQMGMESEIGN